eukprot:294497-Chlamydomonas_euryale.AAC.1
MRFWLSFSVRPVTRAPVVDMPCAMEPLRPPNDEPDAQLLLSPSRLYREPVRPPATVAAAEPDAEVSAVACE